MVNIFSDPLDVTKEWNVIIVITIQNCLGIPAIVIPILSMHFFFFAMIKFISALIEDAKMAIKKIGHKTLQNVRKDLTEIIKLHGKTLE